MMALLTISSPAFAVPPGTVISNIANANFDVSGAPLSSTSNTASMTTVVARSSAAIELLQQDSFSGTPEDVDPNQLCSTTGAYGGPYVPMPNPSNTSGAAIDLNSPVQLGSAPAYRSGQAVFARVTDTDQNLDPALVESIEVQYTAASTGDTEVGVLYETGPDTGIFTGSIMLGAPPPASGDCTLAVGSDSSLSVAYIDPADPSDSHLASALVDPAGVVFDSGTGALMDGVSVTLIDNVTGNPANVFGDDGVSSYPATVVTGTSATDGSGAVYNFTPGQYRFPLVAPGSYRLDVVPVAGYDGPSTVPTPTLQSLPGAPFDIDTGSRGEVFTVGATAVFLDYPLDLETSGLFVNKLASKTHVETGEFVEYRVSVSSGVGTAPAIAAELTDYLPSGFRYENGSGRLADGTPIDPTIDPLGRDLRFALGDLLPGDTVEISYVAAVTQAAPAKVAVNEAVVTAQNGVTSNTATASVTVVEDRIAERVLLIGRVSLDECNEEIDPWESGVPGVRLYLEDGTFVVTDERGRFHVEGLRPGVHIVQLDEATLPDGYEAMSCAGSSAEARQPLSQFVDAQAGSMWRTDFHLRRKRGELTHQLSATTNEDMIDVSLDVEVGRLGVEKLSAVVLIPDGLELVDGSLSLNDAPIEATLTAGALSVPLPEPDADQRFEIAFEARAIDPTAPARDGWPIRAMLIGKDPAGKAMRSEIAEVATSALSSDTETAPVVEAAALHLQVEAPMADVVSRLPEPEPEEIRLEDQYDRYWLDTQAPGQRFVYPEEGFIPGIASVKLAVIHEPGIRAELRLDGNKVSGLNHDGTLFDQERQVAMSRWRGVDIADGENRFEVVFFDGDVETGRIERSVFFTGGPVAAELVEEASTLVADGRENPVIAVRMTDRAGRPVREGVTGHFRVEAPYQSRQQVDELRRNALTRLEEVRPTFIVGADGIAKIQLHPTSVVGQAKVTFSFGADTERDVSAWLSPGDRDWILVAVANGDLGYNATSGNVDILEEQGGDDGFFTEGRIAFFAKGTVRGDWILTVAYDTDKEKEEVGRRLMQVIDPDEYFTLYADDTQQGYDAASSEKLYVKIEREKFYALYGDYQTGLNETELAAYNRTLAGGKTEYYGDRLRVNGFVSQTDQFFQRDEIRGDGTSGLYQLSRDSILIGSDQVSIQTRDRFRSEEILEERPLISGIDYNIDYLKGTIYFRQPILSRDRDQNPIYIVAEYEVEGSTAEDINGGGRAALRFLDGDIEVGASAVHQQAGTERGDLVAGDARYSFGQDSEIRAEVGYTTSEDAGVEQSGIAYLVEVEHVSDDTVAHAYVREVPEDYGLGQQNVSELGTRKYGADIMHEFTPEWIASGEFFRHENLENNRTRNVVEVSGQYDHAPYSASLGVRHVNEGDENTTQLLYGASRSFFEDRLDFYTTGEVELVGGDDSGDYGNRWLLGSDFAINDRVTLFAMNEFLWADGQDSIDTRGGLRVTPWQGATVSTSYTHETMENGLRGFANLGLNQTFKVGDHWSFSGSVDRSQTVLNQGFDAFDPDTPLTTGNATEDFTATSIGAAFNRDGLTSTGRFENRVSQSTVGWGLFLSGLQEHGERTSYAGNFDFFFDDNDDGSQNWESRLRLSFAHRPNDSDWILLNRFDLVFNHEESATFESQTRKLINHFKANQMLTDRMQLAYQVSLKYVVDTINGQKYDTVGGIFGIETRYNFRKNWDASFHARTRHTFDEQVLGSNVGVSIGHSVIRNIWVSVGYNFTGFHDEDFSTGDYTAQGPFVRFRANLDQTVVRDVLDHFRR